MRTKILLYLFLAVLGLSQTAIAQTTTFGDPPRKDDGGGDGSGTSSAVCDITGATVFNGSDDVNNFTLFPSFRNYSGPSSNSGCSGQSWAWTVTGSGLSISGPSNLSSVAVDITNPITADGATVGLTHCCDGSSDCESCEITIDIEAPEVVNINGPNDVNCNTTRTYSPDFLGDANFTTVTWTVNNSNAVLTQVGNNASVAFGPGNYNVQICATACYGTNCQTAAYCETIRVGQAEIEWTEFDDYLCVGTQGTYSVSGGVGNYIWSFNGQVISGVTGSTYTFDPGASGNLSVTGTNACGFTSTVTQAITYVTDPPADPGLILNMTEGETGYPGPLTNIQTCSNATLVLKVLDIDGPNDFADWSYHNVNNLPGPPATFDPNTSNDMVLVFKYANMYQPTLTGRCSVEVIVNNNCFDSQYNSWRTIDISPTGGSGIGGCGGGFKFNGVEGEDGEMSEYFQVSPNPASSEVNVHYQVSREMNLSMSLMDMNGKEVDQIFTNLEHTPTPFQANFGVSNYANGVYFCVLKDQDGNVVFSEKLVVNKE